MCLSTQDNLKIFQAVEPTDVPEEVFPSFAVGFMVEDGGGFLVILILGLGVTASDAGFGEAVLEDSRDSVPSSVFSRFGAVVPPSFSNRRFRIYELGLAICNPTLEVVGGCTCSIFSLSGASGVLDGGGGSISMIATVLE